MAFWNKKKNEPKTETAHVECSCGASYETECDGLGTMDTGYKGRLSFYTRCTHCDRMVYIEEMKLPKRYVAKAYKNHIWC